MDPRECAFEVHHRLLEKYGEPTWHTPLPPLDELISTILSQNTTDLNRDRAFNQLKQCFDSWDQVRDADSREVINAIRSAGLGNQKGPRIQNILRQITAERGTLDLSFLMEMPDDEAWDWLRQFKGVGPKTASIVLLFSLGKSAFPVDTHIYRVTGRIGLRPEKMNAEKAHRYLAELFPPATYKAAHMNIIRLGRDVCHPRKPNCEICILQSLCAYYQKSQIRL
jgi:endonuclease-3